MSKIITHNEDGISNIEKIIKYCSVLRKEFQYPYYFEYNFSTNHIDNSKDGELKDSTYFSFNVARYPYLRQGIGRSAPVSKQVIFGPIWTIIENGRWVSCLLDNLDLNFSLSDIITKQEEIKYRIDEYLCKELIESANKSIKQYNEFYPTQEPETFYSYYDKTVLKRKDDSLKCNHSDRCDVPSCQHKEPHDHVASCNCSWLECKYGTYPKIKCNIL